MNLGEILDNFQQSIHESFGFSFLSFLFVSLFEADKKLLEKWKSALNFASVQTSNFQQSAVLIIIYHNQMNIMEHA